MARKKKAAKVPYATCLHCGANMKKRFKACTSCGRANMARNEAVKASIGASFVAKSAGPRPAVQSPADARRDTLIAMMTTGDPSNPAHREAARRVRDGWMFRGTS